MNKSSYYKWLDRQGTLNRHEQNRLNLIVLIRKFHEEHPSFGYRDIAERIRETQGWMISALYVHKGCKFLGIRSQAKHYFWKKHGDENLHYKNIVNGNWNAQRPLEIVTSDMTVLRHRGVNYEWTYILDTFNNSIIASAISRRKGDVLPYYDCLEQLKKIIEKEESTEPIIFHSDQGSVYSSQSFAEAHRNYNIIRSMSRAGTPTDNPIIESINGWIKAEVDCDYSINEWDTLDDFLTYYIQFFNFERPAYKLNYKTPAQFTTKQGFQCFF